MNGLKALSRRWRDWPQSWLPVFFLLAPEWIDRASNQIVGDTGRAPSAEALALHQQLTVGDLHADSALWGRDLFTNNKWGQVDLPKLIAGGATMQIFTTVTKYTPWLER